MNEADPTTFFGIGSKDYTDILRYERIRILRGGSIVYIKNQGFTNSWEVEGIANSSILSLAR
ncbi:hypothetical protein P4647_04000 [Peribacillus frigoritolerans]|uniref:hypothetical protein n=1 Tax=Peribacillus frigoritolerans TaxID=450367 RepID=UPI002E1B228B|nr:hypothetical protein [Peribacillus frigoritolerans]